MTVRMRQRLLTICIELLLAGTGLLTMACSDSMRASASAAFLATPTTAVGQAPARTPRISSPPPPSDATAEQDPARVALDDLPALRAGQSLGAWKGLHDRDIVEPYVAALVEPMNENWCARARSEIVLDPERTLRQAAYFYLPDRPEPPVLPVGTAAELVNQCRLGLVWV
jgi:hypothetical protein